MPTEYKSLKVPLRLWSLFDAYLKTHVDVYDSATNMIHGVIKDKAKELLQEMITELEEKKANWEKIKELLDSIS